jgi:hypothetical protein
MRRAAWGVLAVAVLAGPAQGMERLPRVSETFADHAACLAALQAHSAREMALRAPRTTDAQGRTREVQVSDSGFERRGRERASRGTEILVLEGAPDAATGLLRIVPRITLIDRDCEGAEMITGGLRGVLRPFLE